MKLTLIATLLFFIACQAQPEPKSTGPAGPKALANIEVAKRSELLSGLRNKICEAVKANRAAETGVKAASYTLEVFLFRDIGLVGGILPEYPNAMDMQSTYYKEAGDVYCTSGGFTGGDCGELLTKHEVLESYNFKGTPDETAALAECKD